MRICSGCRKQKESIDFRGENKTCISCGESVRKWQEANLEKKRESDRKYREANLEKVRESVRNWQKANPEKARESVRKYREANLEKKRESFRKWQRANPAKAASNNYRRRARMKTAVSTLTDREWRETKQSYGGKCVYCGGSNGDTLDHIVPVISGGAHSADNVVPACSHCNSSKGGKSLLRFLYDSLNR